MIKDFSQYKKNNKPPKNLVVLLHGYGSNKNDLISLAPYFDKALPDSLFVSPNAPQACDMLADGYQWFPLDDGFETLRLDNLKDKDSKKELHRSVKNLNYFIDEQLKNNDINAENVFLIGFSQGSSMAMYSSLQRKIPVKAVVAYSGLFLNDIVKNVKSKPCVVGVSHGTLDDVVPFNWHQHNCNLLKSLDIKVKELSVEHSFHEISAQALQFGMHILEEASDV